jgi:hypothetical protein
MMYAADIAAVSSLMPTLFSFFRFSFADNRFSPFHFRRDFSPRRHAYFAADDRQRQLYSMIFTTLRRHFER